MKPEHVRAALHAVDLKPQTSRLLAHMADVADDRGLFFQARARTAHALGVHPDTIKAALRELIRAGYVSEAREAVAGKAARRLRLHPHAWTQPAPLAPIVHTQTREPVTQPDGGPDAHSTDPSPSEPPSWARPDGGPAAAAAYATGPAAARAALRAGQAPPIAG